ncbi:hypothetical protein GE09DRAFT_1224251 [Coniochaeta sp. 2T2.1]|nr:hypothetical protein GE09DRAFT_1224251 [Coniochaeta sp. 2T2.1]
MKAALILAVAGLAVAQNLSGEPPCATSCLSSAISRAGCALDDQACQCGPTQTAIGGFAAPCLLGACAASDLIIAQSVGAELCSIFSASAGTTTTSPGTGTVTTSTTSDTSPTAATTTTTSSESTTGGSTTTTRSSTSSTSSSSSTSTTGASTVSGNLAAAATPAVFGALAALMGVVAAL